VGFLTDWRRQTADDGGKQNPVIVGLGGDKGGRWEEKKKSWCSFLGPEPQETVRGKTAGSHED